MGSQHIESTPRRAIGFAIVLGLHALFFWALTGGLIQHVVVATPRIVEAQLIDEVPPEPEPPASPPPRMTVPRITVLTLPEIAIEEPPSSAPALSQAVSNSIIVPPSVDHRRPLSRVSYAKTGTVILNLTVGDDGRVTAAAVAKSSGIQELDDATVKQARTWRFRPGTVDGKPSAMRFLFRVTYWPRMQDRKVKYDPQSCAPMRDIAEMPVIDDRTILVRGPGKKYRRVDMANRCVGLGKADHFSYDYSIDNICELIAVIPAQDVGRLCLVEKIVSIDETEARALLARR